MKSRPRGAGGYALLGALLVAAVAAVFASMSVAAVLARQQVTEADAGDDRISGLLIEGLDETCFKLRMGFCAAPGAFSSSPAGTEDDRWNAAVSYPPGAPTSGVPRVVVQVTAHSRGLQRGLEALVEMRVEPFAQGVVVAGDVELDAPFTVTGSGVYCGGTVRGREWLEFSSGSAPQPGDPPSSDCVHGERWSRASVHALGGIWWHGQEVHGAVRPQCCADDTDVHVPGDQGLDDLVSCSPPPALLCALKEASVAPGAALHDGILDLALLPVRRPGVCGSDVYGGGYVCVVTPDGDAGLRVVGERAEQSCPLTLVIAGDVQLAADGQPANMGGTLIVCGALDVSGPVTLRGHLYAARFCVHDPCSVVVPGDWRARPCAGVAVPTLVGRSASD